MDLPKKSLIHYCSYKVRTSYLKYAHLWKPQRTSWNADLPFHSFSLEVGLPILFLKILFQQEPQQFLNFRLLNTRLRTARKLLESWQRRWLGRETEWLCEAGIMFYFVLWRREEKYTKKFILQCYTVHSLNNRTQWNPSSITEKSILRKLPTRNIPHGVVHRARLESPSARDGPKHKGSAGRANQSLKDTDRAGLLQLLTSSASWTVSRLTGICFI